MNTNPETNGPTLNLDNTGKQFPDGTVAVDGISFAAAAGELVALLGESGCGKTTTLKMINRLIDATSGRIEINGQDVSGLDAVTLRRSIGYVFQGIGLFPHMTVAENVGITPVLLGWEAEAIRARVDELLTLVQLDPSDYRDRNPAELSGGQRQRVGFARALATSPSVMLLDEPFGALDPITRDALQREFMAIHQRLNLTTVLVTHDMTEALLMADRILVLKDGAVEQMATPQALVASPSTPYVATLMDMPRRQVERLETYLG
jgi:osmoprotectant transport system ATP-binding protein